MMRFKYYTLLLGIVSTIIMVGCSNLSSEEKKIVGKYYISETEEVDTEEDETEMTLTLEMEQEFLRDKTTSMTGTIKVIASYEDYDYYNSVTLEYRLGAVGTWELNGKNIIERTNPQKVTVDYVGATSLHSDDFSRTYVKLLTQYLDTMLPSMRKEMTNSTSEIISNDSYEMVLRDKDDDTEITYTKIK